MDKLIEKHLDAIDIKELSYTEQASAHTKITKEVACGFAEWCMKKYYKQRLTSTHPNKIGLWFSDYEDTGFLTTSELFDIYIKSL